uniref:Uncharacterized protein n=1 Tax=Anopheles dirus TaxID=7168 RepID=A0A182NW13_9DIPT
CVCVCALVREGSCCFAGFLVESLQFYIPRGVIVRSPLLSSLSRYHFVWQVVQPFCGGYSTHSDRCG